MDLKPLFSEGLWESLMGDGDRRSPHPVIERHLKIAQDALLRPDLSEVERGVFIGVIQYHRWLRSKLPNKVLGKKDESDIRGEPRRVAALSSQGWPR